MLYVADCMRTQVFTVDEGATLREAIRIMGHHMIGTVPVIDGERNIVGVVVLDDVLTEFMPQFVQVLRALDFVHDYGAFETGPRAAHLADKPLKNIMRPPFFLAADSGLMEAMVFMHNHQVSDVPVVDDQKKLVGLVSRVRVGSLFLIDWLNKLPEKAE